MENVFSFATEPKYLTDGKSFYWNPLCPDNHLLFSTELTLDEIRNELVPVRIFRSGEPVEPSGVLPDDVEANTRRL